MQMKIKIPAQTVTVDLEVWAEEYGVEATPSAVRADIKAYFDGWIQSQIDWVTDTSEGVV